MYEGFSALSSRYAFPGIRLERRKLRRPPYSRGKPPGSGAVFSRYIATASNVNGPDQLRSAHDREDLLVLFRIKVFASKKISLVRVLNPAGAAGAAVRGRAAGPDLARVQAGEGFCAVDEAPGQVGQAAVADPGAVTQEAERLVHVHPEALGELALSLLDDHPAVQRGLQLLVQGVAVAHAALVQQADGGHVGQRLADADVRGRQGARDGAEQVQRADDLLPQPHRQRLH